MEEGRGESGLEGLGRIASLGLGLGRIASGWPEAGGCWAACALGSPTAQPPHLRHHSARAARGPAQRLQESLGGADLRVRGKGGRERCAVGRRKLKSRAAGLEVHRGRGLPPHTRHSPYLHDPTGLRASAHLARVHRRHDAPRGRAGRKGLAVAVQVAVSQRQQHGAQVEWVVGRQAQQQRLQRLRSGRVGGAELGAVLGSRHTRVARRAQCRHAGMQ